MYNCAQGDTRQHKPKKGKTDGKQCDKDQMDTFKCKGWLHISVTEGSTTALVKFKHEDDHVPYCNIEVPDGIQEYILANTHLNPTQVRNESTIYCYLILMVLRSSCGLRY